MSATEYASAVAAVKAMESSLLSHADIDQLINAKTLSELNVLINSKTAGEQSLNSVWQLVKSYAPDCRELDILLYRNDFHNLKAALKALLSNRSPEIYYITPTNLELETLSSALSSKEYDKFPVYMREAAESAYDILTRTLDGQLSDSLIDAAALSAMQRSAEEYRSGFMLRYAQLVTVCSDIKTAYRCSIMEKSREFLDTAVCGSPELDKELIIRASLGGRDQLLSFLDATPYNELSEALKSSSAQFEKLCDDMITEHAETTRLQAFGYEPLAAYYIAKEAEIKNLRIIKMCRECGAERDIIAERMRRLYV